MKFVPRQFVYCSESFNTKLRIYGGGGGRGSSLVPGPSFNCGGGKQPGKICLAHPQIDSGDAQDAHKFPLFSVYLFHYYVPPEPLVQMNLSLLCGLIGEPIRKTCSLDAVLIKVKDARNRKVN